MPFKVGIWHDVTGINFFRNFTETYSEIVESLQNKTLVVTTIMVSIDQRVPSIAILGVILVIVFLGVIFLTPSGVKKNHS